MPAFHNLSIQDIRQETDDCVSVSFAVPESLVKDYHFIQGQYLTLRTTLDGQEVRRSYSICSSPFENDLRVAIKKVPGGKFSTFANEKLQVGDTLDVMTPVGNFYYELQPEQANHYVAFAAGSGITPVLSNLKAILSQEPQSHFTLFYGNRNKDSIIFKEQLEALKNKYLNRLSVHYVLSREHPGSELFYGRIDTDKCDAFCNLLLDVEEVTAFFICGPEPMIHGIRETLEARGVNRKQLKFELFTSPDGSLNTEQPRRHKPTKSIHSQITIQLDGNTFTFPLDSQGDTILDTALKNGADLPFSCKGGVCSTCRARLLEGEVEMETNYALEPEEVEAGYILTCQSHPTTDTVVVSYDE